MKKITIDFNKHKFEVEYTIKVEFIIDNEVYDNHILIESIKLNGVDFYWNFNDETICNIQQIVLNTLKY